MTDTNAMATAQGVVSGLNPFNPDLALQDVIVKYFSNAIDVLKFSPILLLFLVIEIFVVNWLVSHYLFKQFNLGIINYVFALFVVVVTFPLVYPLVAGRFGL